MMNSRPSLIAAAAFLAFGLCLPAFAPAQTWPSKPIRVIVPFPPAGMPADLIARLNAEIAKALARADFLEKLAAEGSEPLGGSPQRSAEFMRAEQAEWGAAVRASGAKAD